MVPMDETAVDLARAEILQPLVYGLDRRDGSRDGTDASGARVSDQRAELRERIDIEFRVVSHSPTPLCSAQTAGQRRRWETRAATQMTYKRQFRTSAVHWVRVFDRPAFHQSSTVAVPRRVVLRSCSLRIRRRIEEA